MMKMLSLAFSLFLLIDSFGNIPLFLSLLKAYSPKRQRSIIFREMLIGLLVITLFMFLGDAIMRFLQISESAIQVAGGIILFLICLKMIFPRADDPKEKVPHSEEPLIVPLAVPLIAGPAVLAAVIIYSHEETSLLAMLGAILIAWGASLIVLLASSFLKSLLGWRGITAIERLMGLLLILIAVQMFLSGIHNFMLSCSNV